MVDEAWCYYYCEMSDLGDCVIWVGVMGAVMDEMRCYGHCGGGARNGGAALKGGK
jgi:hypothetical protein